MGTRLTGLTSKEGWQTHLERAWAHLGRVRKSRNSRRSSSGRGRQAISSADEDLLCLLCRGPALDLSQNGQGKARPWDGESHSVHAPVGIS